MGLPAFDLPIPPLGVEIPLLMHPPLTHFAIVLPIFILLLELINLIMRRRGLTATAFVFFTLLIVVYVAAFITGKTDGKEAFDMLTQAGQETLKEHKLIGIYLMLFTVVLVFAKLFSMAIKKWWMKLIYLLILTGFVAAVLYQGKEGGELVYKHGANVERVKALDDKVFDLEDQLDDLKSEKTTEQKEPEPTTAKQTEENPQEANETTTATVKEEEKAALPQTQPEIQEDNTQPQEEKNKTTTEVNKTTTPNEMLNQLIDSAKSKQ